MLIYLSLLDTQEQQHKFTQLYNTYRYTMMYTADSILHDHSLSEDAVHDAFLRIARNFHKIGPVDSPRTKAFVVIIVRNVALSMAKRRNREFVFEDETTINIVSDATTDREFDNMNFDDIVHAIKQLPDIYKDILFLNVVEEYSIKEISEILQIPNETVKKRLQRGRRKLIEHLQKEGIV